MQDAQDTPEASPWHPGELAMQATIGAVAKMDMIGRNYVRDHLIEQHRDFFEQLPFAVFGAVDPQGMVWASPRAGIPGFLNALDPTHLHVETLLDPADPASAGLGTGSAVAMIGIEPWTRRRNRLNGHIEQAESGGFTITVEESFGNCPQYIQRRAPQFTRDPALPSPATPETLAMLDAEARALIANTDSFYVASYADTARGRRVDVSHRGGRPGFVRVDEQGALTIPDFAGNQFFNTLGNIRESGKAGVVFIDWASGDLLQISGEAEVVLDSPEIAAFDGAERLWRLRPAAILRRPAGLALTWQFTQDPWSPSLAETGIWSEAEARLNADQAARSWRRLRIARIVEESSLVRSFHLEAVDGRELVAPLAGQHLPIRVMVAGQSKPLIRTYTLSSAPGDATYRISVKREGLVSRHLHSLAPGAVIEARVPAGDFTIDAQEKRPAVLLAAGIGITPILAMARHLLAEGLRTGTWRRAWLIYAARTRAERAFAQEIATIAAASHGTIHALRVLSRTDDAEQGADYDRHGRIDMDLLRATLPFDDFDFYLCGPSPFMQDVYDGLRAMNIADQRIHAEAFGPAAMERKPDTAEAAAPTLPPAEEPVEVGFARAGSGALWQPVSGSLLELAEASGLSPEFGCRSGSCGTCRTRVLAGAVTHTRQTGATLAADEALLCCAVPAKDSGPLSLDL